MPSPISPMMCNKRLWRICTLLWSGVVSVYLSLPQVSLHFQFEPPWQHLCLIGVQILKRVPHELLLATCMATSLYTTLTSLQIHVC